MELKTELEYSNETERLNFIVENNHNNGYKISEKNYIDEEGIEHKVIQAYGYTAEEKQQQEQEYIANLSLTAADVERALYKAFGKDFDDIIAMCEALNSSGTADIDIKALKIELKANNFYRGNPYISQIGALLGISETQLDEFFETNDYTKLVQ